MKEVKQEKINPFRIGEVFGLYCTMNMMVTGSKQKSHGIKEGIEGSTLPV
nr:hypothetical protein [Neobacillus cucumis]